MIWSKALMISSFKKKKVTSIIAFMCKLAVPILMLLHYPSL